MTNSHFEVKEYGINLSKSLGSDDYARDNLFGFGRRNLCNRGCYTSKNARGNTLAIDRSTQHLLLLPYLGCRFLIFTIRY